AITAAERSDSAVPATPSTATPAAEPPSPPCSTKGAENDEENEKRKDDVGARADVRRAVPFRPHALQHHVSSLRDTRDDAGGTCPQAWPVCTLTEFGRHVLTACLSSEAVGDELFEVVAHLDPHLPVVDGEENQDAVVATALANAATTVL